MAITTSSPIGLHSHEISILLGWHRAREQECVKLKQYLSADYHLRRSVVLEDLSAPPVVTEVEENTPEPQQPKGDGSEQ